MLFLGFFFLLFLWATLEEVAALDTRTLVEGLYHTDVAKHEVCFEALLESSGEDAGESAFKEYMGGFSWCRFVTDVGRHGSACLDLVGSLLVDEDRKPICMKALSCNVITGPHATPWDMHCWNSCSEQHRPELDTHNNESVHFTCDPSLLEEAGLRDQHVCFQQFPDRLYRGFMTPLEYLIVLWVNLGFVIFEGCCIGFGSKRREGEGANLTLVGVPGALAAWFHMFIIVYVLADFFALVQHASGRCRFIILTTPWCCSPFLTSAIQIAAHISRQGLELSSTGRLRLPFLLGAVPSVLGALLLGLQLLCFAVPLLVAAFWSLFAFLPIVAALTIATFLPIYLVYEGVFALSLRCEFEGAESIMSPAMFCSMLALIGQLGYVAVAGFCVLLHSDYMAFHKAFWNLTTVLGTSDLHISSPSASFAYLSDLLNFAYVMPSFVLSLAFWVVLVTSALNFLQLLGLRFCSQRQGQSRSRNRCQPRVVRALESKGVDSV